MDIILIGVVLIVLIAVAAIIFFAVWLWKKNNIWKFLISFGVIAFGINVYQAIYPNDSFYEREFTRVSSLKFPESGKILNKYASYPDLHGDYTACALIEISPIEYEALRKTIESNSLSTKLTGASGCAQNEKWSDVLPNYTASIKVSKAGGHESEWGVLEGGRLMYFSFSNW